MIIFSIATSFLNAIISLGIGLFVYLKNKRAPVNKAFGLFCLASTIWGWSYFFWRISNNQFQALFWSRALMAGAIFIPICYLYFSAVLVNKIKETKKILLWGILLFSIFFILNFTSLIVKDVQQRLIYKFWPTAGILFSPFLLLWFIYSFYAVYLLLQAERKATGDQKTQLRYILIGTAIGYLGGATNYPLWFGVHILPVGNWSVALYLLIVAYVILRYRLFDIKIILTQFLVFVLCAVSLVKLFLAKGWQAISIEGGFLVFLTILGILFIRSVLKEVKQREKLEILTKTLEAANEKLKQLDKLKSEFLSFASHQVKSPMAIVKGYATLIADGTLGKVPDGVKDVAGKIKGSADQLIALVNNLLDLRKIEEGRMEYNFDNIDIVKFIEDITENSKNLAKNKGLELTFEAGLDEINVKIDTQKFSQVIQNLIDNAIKYTSKGWVKVFVNRDENNILISVSDSGRGISKELNNKLFEQFSRDSSVKKEIQGTGLGLYIAKQIVSAHQGEIWAESEGEGKGSKFMVKLPLGV